MPADQSHFKNKIYRYIIIEFVFLSYDFTYLIYMPRKILVRTNEHPYHITSRSNHKTWFSIPLQEVWGICKHSISIANKKHPVNIHSFVLMSNHYHLILDTPNSDIDKFMYELNKNISLTLRKETGMINRMFGGRYKWSLITNQIQYLHVMKYVYRNPVKAKISLNVEDYPYSTLNTAFKSKEFTTKLKPHINVQKHIQWFNTTHSDVQNDSISTGLNKTIFNFAGSRQKSKATRV